jgi:7-cyano-7-deazaguanine synthase
MKCVVLLSGGIDSATTAAIAKTEGMTLYALTVNYGQRHAKELESACKIAALLGVVEHKVVSVDLRAWGGSALTSPNIPVPQRAVIADDIPITYVPARNLVLLSLATSYAEAVGAEKIYFGANSLDYSGYPDCRPEFVQAFQQAAALGTKCGVEGRPIEIHAPLQYLTKIEIIRKGMELGLDYSLTWSCYQGEARACGLCDSCKIRLAAFAALEQTDPIAYAE